MAFLMSENGNFRYVNALEIRARLVERTGRFNKSMIDKKQKRCFLRWIRNIGDQCVHFELQQIVAGVDWHQRFCHLGTKHNPNILDFCWLWRRTQWHGFASFAQSKANTCIVYRIFAYHVQNTMEFFAWRFEHLLCAVACCRIDLPP